MSRFLCAQHVWLVTSEHLEPPKSTIRVRCWRCSKRYRWPASYRDLTRGTWTEWLKRAQGGNVAPVSPMDAARARDRRQLGRPL
jgi:hypothetical protein